MIKTFTSSDSNGTESKLQVCRVPAGIRLTLGTDETHNAWFDPKLGAEIALAILEAAGHTEDSRNFGTAVHELGLAIKEQEHEIAKAKEQAELEAELEAEALELFNARQEAIHSIDWDPYEDFATEESKQTWLAVARKAREMRAEK